MSSLSRLKQTYPPPARPAANSPSLEQQFARSAAVSVQSADRSAVNSRSDEEAANALSAALHSAGFVPSKVRVHSIFAGTLDAMWSHFGFTFSGNFTEGWGYNLYAMNGRPGFDSSVAYKHTVEDCVVHCEDCSCPGRGQLICRIAPDSSVLQMSPAVLPTMRKIGLVYSSDGEVHSLDAAFGRRTKRVMSRCSANPEVSFTEQLLCCEHFTRSVVQSLQLPSSWRHLLEGQRISLRPRPYRASPQGRGGGPWPEAEPDFSGLERVLFHQLSEEQGHLYMLLKYLMLEALPQLLPKQARPFTEVHCRQLLWHLLSEPRPQPQQNLVEQARQGLQLLSRMLMNKKQNSRSVAMPNFFYPRLTVPLVAEAGTNLPELIDRTGLCRVLSTSQKLIQKVDAYVSKLRETSAAGSGNGDYFVFWPLLMTISGSCPTAVSGIQPMASIADYPSVGFKLYRALDILLDEGQPSLSVDAEFSAIVTSLRRCAATAAACLRSLMMLKTGQGSRLAQEALMESGAQVSVTDCFQVQSLTSRMVESALLKTDCGWIYRCKLDKVEKDNHKAEFHSPMGTQFLASYPLIRCLFFPAHRKPIFQTEQSRFEYRLRVNFVALWNSLRSQLGNEWGSCVTTAGQIPVPDMVASAQNQIEAQEIFAQALICKSAPTRHHLLASFQGLLASAAPFYLDRSRCEWRWLHLIRLHLMGTWLNELQPAATGGSGDSWSSEQKRNCCELIDWCNRHPDLFHCAVNGLGVSAMLHIGGGAAAEVQARLQLRSLLETEMQQAFPLTPESGYDHDLLVMQLYASHWSKGKARAEFQHKEKLLRER